MRTVQKPQGHDQPAVYKGKLLKKGSTINFVGNTKKGIVLGHIGPEDPHFEKLLERTSKAGVSQDLRAHTGPFYLVKIYRIGTHGEKKKALGTLLLSHEALGFPNKSYDKPAQISSRLPIVVR